MHQEEKSIRDLLRRWLSGDSRRGDERQLDRHAHDDPFLADALEGYRQHAGSDHSRRLEELRARLHQRTRRRGVFPLWPRAAAAAFLLAIAGGIWWWGARSSADRPAETTVMLEEPVTEAVPAEPGALAFTDTLAGERGEPSIAEAAPPPVREQSRRRQPQPEAKPSPAPQAGIALAEESDATSPPAAAARTLRPAAAPPGKTGRDIHGKVSSEAGSPLAGVVVAVPEKNIRTLTDDQGQYRLQIDSNVNRLTFAAPGFDDETKLIGDADTLNVVLAFPPASEPGEEETVPKAKTAETPAATPRGGFDKLERYLRRNLRYPAEARAQGIEGAVRLQFTVRSNGVPADFRILESPGYGCGEEAIRLLREGPRWKLPAGSQENTRTYDVVFKLN